MKALNLSIVCFTTFFTSLFSTLAQADWQSVQQAVADSKTSLNLRYRFEWVDQDGRPEDALASTLRSRLSWKSGSANGFFVQWELDNVAELGDDKFNNTRNGRADYPVVADPKGTDLNQAYLGYKYGNWLMILGRQRINHNDERFVGGVGWRQNEQTFDGYRLQYEINQAVSLDYSYIYNVNRIFGPTGPTANLNGGLHLFNALLKLDKAHQFAFYGYDMDFDSAAALSNRTLGFSYDGTFDKVKLHTAYARQSDTGNNPDSYSADYWNLEIGTQLAAFNLGAGYEVLGSDNGKGFITPLATLHKFQGFVDQFLATPGTGIRDLYVKLGTKVGKMAWTAIWHDLSADTGGLDYGTELDLIAAYPLADQIGLMVKYAHYSSDSFATDTSKFWTMVTVSF
ncbi:alginate export family protein [Rheinheimera soli]|uniref:Alginate export domain-containing protein n=1 Tax=Rheinheimera soli TaxID=443616 RepID=A0ABU1W018_9GAMM|nr:alginate export family protein [Rheinheimera soli]MDR7121316.1 hypothetical protein [Rheinheimera soli]